MILGIYGSGGLGREIYEIANRRNLASSLWNQIIFIDDFGDDGALFDIGANIGTVCIPAVKRGLVNRK